MPETTPTHSESKDHPHHHTRGHEDNYLERRRTAHGRGVLGIILIVIGSSIFVQQYFQLNLWRYFMPIVLVAIGIAFVLRRD